MLVWPLTVMVEVVNWTCGTVTVVTREVVMLLAEMVRPEEMPVECVAGIVTGEE